MMAEEKASIPLPEVEIVQSSNKVQEEAADSAAVPEDDIRSRPATATSRTSTSSVSTKRTDTVRLTKYIMDTYFSYREGAFDSAVSQVMALVVKPEDGQVLGSWLLMEIDQWDCEKEKLVMLTEKSLIVVRYDFVKNRVYKEKVMALSEVTSLKAGNLNYPSRSVMPPRDHGGVRVARDKEENAGFFARWSWSGAGKMPYWTFCHHRLIYLEGEGDNLRYNVDHFYEALCDQVRALNTNNTDAKQVEIVEGDIMVYTYLSLTSMIYNQSSLGFSKERGGVNY